VRRGFGEEAKRLAVEVRIEVGLDHREPFDPRGLAELYGIPIYPLDRLVEYGCSTEAVTHFTGLRAAVFSAALLPIGAGVIIENPIHAETRRSASIAHEMGHILLEHEFTETILTLDGCRFVPKDIEQEADRLGGELQIPFRAALEAARKGWSNEEVAQFYGVSSPFAAMRMNASGARKIASRQRDAYRKTVSSRS
jgi:hypothetical protein